MSGTDLGTRWTVYVNPVDYCLRRNTPDVCQLELDVWIMLSVVVLGIIKMIVLIWVLFQWWLDSAHYFKTVGDALSSFLERQDPTTCLVTASQLKKHGWKGDFEPQMYKRRGLGWVDSMSRPQF
jgi:hypothetical protein